ncbi:NUDIX hydrolase [Paracoccus sp. ME4]|uniref:NUDIX hydrolase n=1 Tax=Paracoccus sp. ME4 TaxID=3138066 RepID=UPI00398AE159
MAVTRIIYTGTVHLGIWGPLDRRCAAATDALEALIGKRGTDAFGRDPRHDHITASGFVVSPDRRRVLLMHHAKLDRWLQPGGHCDGSANTLEVARRELREETGLSQARLVTRAIVDIDRHLIPARRDEPAHHHVDLRYLFEADPALPISRNQESRALAWVEIDRLEAYTDNPALLVIRTIAEEHPARA